MEHGDLANAALGLFQAALAEADPEAAVIRQMTAAPLPDLAVGGRRIVIALGKAAVPMMRAALGALPAAPSAALAITNPENAQDVPGAEVLCGAHPVPDASSAEAGARVLRMVQDLGPEDHVLVLISGGGSALMVAPAAGITLDDKAAVVQLLLRSGLDITAMNLVRQQLSALKGGGLVRAAAPARVTSYILSDVIGNDLRAIASGPTADPLGTKAGAAALLREVGIWQDLPPSVRRCLTAGQDTPDTSLRGATENIIIGSNEQSLAAMAARARADGWQIACIEEGLTGDVGAACAHILQRLRTTPRSGRQAFLFGGETTVRLQGQGRGGRNQELALRVAKAASEEGWANAYDWVFVSAGTDGRDGPTDAAGGMVDGQTWAQLVADRTNPQNLLADNDSYAALRAADALIMTGGTGTNVADVQILLRA